MTWNTTPTKTPPFLSTNKTPAPLNNVKEDLFIGVLEDSLRQGQWVVITHAPDKETASKINVLLEHVHGANNIVNN